MKHVHPVCKREEICTHIGHSGKTPRSQEGSFTKWFLGVVMVFMYLSWLGLLHDINKAVDIKDGEELKTPKQESAATKSKSKQTKDDEFKKTTDELEKQKPIISDWDYSTYQDEMTSKPIRSAWLTSINEFELDRPYSGKQHATLTVRRHPRYKLDIILEVERGQFICSMGCKVLVRFDEHQPVWYRANGPADYGTTSLFISGSAGFLSKLRKSKSVIIEATMFEEGTRRFRFHTEDLKFK